MSSFHASHSAGKRHLLIVVLALFSFGFTPNAQLLENAASEYEVSLTCTFDENIREKKQNFQIVDELLDNALECQWKKETLYCTAKDGYTYDWKLSDTAAVRKLLSQEKAPATCSCFLVAHDDTSFEKPCDVTVSGHEFTRAPSKETSRHFGDSGSRNSSTRPSEDLHSKEAVMETTGVILIAIALVLIFVMVVATIICRRYGIDYCGRKTHSSTSQCNFGDPEAGQERKPLHVQERDNLHP